MKPRTWSVLLALILLLALARHIWLAVYVHPYADDFSYAVAGMRQPLLERLAQEYASWNGRYFSNVLVLRNPLVLGLDEGLVLYRTIPIALILFTWFATYRFLSALAGTSRYRTSAGFVALAGVLLFLHGLPDASEGIYWYTGAVTYQVPNALGLILVANWIIALRRELHYVGPLWWCVQALLVIIIAGCNELHMAYLVLFHGGLLIWCRSYVPPAQRTVLIFLGLSVVCGLVVALAPGNATRGANFPLRHEIVRTLGYSVAQTGRFIGEWLLDPVFLLASALFIAWRRRAPNARVLFTPFLDRRVALVLPAVVVFVAMFVTYWPTGLLGQYRTVNAAWFFFLPTWFVMLAVWEPHLPGWIQPGLLSSRILKGLTIAAALLLFVIGRDGKLSYDLLFGRAARYDHAVAERYRLITLAVGSGENGPLELPAIEPPRSLVVLPLNASPDHWVNRSMADYFGNAQLNIIASTPPVEAE
jgi:hypothetical protein